MRTIRPRLHRGQPVGGLRKLTPHVKPPHDSVLARMSAQDRQTLLRRLAEPYECVYDPVFRRQLLTEREADVFAAAEAAEDVLNEPVADKRNITLVLSAEQERELFTKFNYCRCRVMRILKRYAGRRIDSAAVRALLRWDAAAHAVRAEILKLNTSLVLAMARRARNSNVELGELISEGNLALLRCVDKFDCARGFKFSTYACRAILAGFSRAGTKTSRYRMQFPTPFDPALERSDHLERTREQIEDDCVDELKRILEGNSAELSGVEQSVLTLRFALDSPESEDAESRKGRTLEEVGDLLGVSKERVRQIQNQAFRKLRNVLEGQYLVAS